MMEKASKSLLTNNQIYIFNIKESVHEPRAEFIVSISIFIHCIKEAVGPKKLWNGNTTFNQLDVV